jgi:hypothetical protein
LCRLPGSGWRSQQETNSSWSDLILKVRNLRNFRCLGTGIPAAGVLK